MPRMNIIKAATLTGIILLLIGFSFISITCDIFQPKDRMAHLVLQLRDAEKPTLAKSHTMIDQMYISVQKDGNDVYENTLTPQGDQFVCDVELKPGNGYSVGLIGRHNGFTVAQATEEGINLSEGQTRTVVLTWQRFMVQLVQPEDGVILNQTSPQLTWNPCPGAEQYALQVDSDASFASPDVEDTIENETSYTISDSLSNDHYFWRLRARDHRNNWGEWSETWQFDIDGKFIKIEPTSLTLNSDKDSQDNFEIYSNTNWTVSDTANWLNVAPESGSDSSSVMVTATHANNSTSSRSATVTVDGVDTGSKSLIVTQSGAGAYLTVSSTNVVLYPAANSNDEIRITSNTDWTVSTESSWLSVFPKRGSDSSNVMITAISANSSTSNRSAVVTVNGEGVNSISISVTQIGANAYLIVSPDHLTLSDTANSQSSFDIKSNTSWTVSNDASWLNISPDNGSDSSSIAVTATSANPSTNVRNATVTVEGDSVNSKTITVSQSGEALFLNVIPATLTLSSAANSQASFEIESNTSWTLGADSAWLSLSKEKGSDSSKVNVTATLNPKTEPRNARITVSGVGIGSIYINVTQSAATPFLLATPSSISLPATGSENTVNIESNTDWSASVSSFWLRLSKTQGSGNDSLIATASPNPETTSRSGTITFSFSGIEKSISVMQSGSDPFLQINPDSLSLPANKSGDSIQVESNIEWNVDYDATWLQVSPLNGSGNCSLSISAIENITTKPRSDQVIVKGNDIEERIIVNQLGADPFLNVDPEEINLSWKEGSNKDFYIYSNTDWMIKQDALWLTLSQNVGYDSATITVSASSNQKLEPRTEKLIIDGKDLNSKEITVIQSGVDLYFEVYPDTVFLPQSANSAFYVTVNSDTNWIVNKDSGWFSVIPTHGAGTSTIKVTANSLNRSEDYREGKINVNVSENISKSVIVRQYGLETGTVTDIDGNSYKTVKIGNQWWMAENLKVTHYRNGDPVPKTSTNSWWEGLTTGAYCYYGNNENYVSTFGNLYNWYVISDDRNIAPEGWHVPTIEEWLELADLLGGEDVAGGKIKDVGTQFWSYPNTGATDLYYFTALPGGYRGNDGIYYDINEYTAFWSSTENNQGTGAYGYCLYYNSSKLSFLAAIKTFGYSIRCVKN